MSMFDQQQMGMMGVPGFTYNGMNQQQMTTFKNTLSEDQINMLMQNSEQFSLSITNEEMLRAICNHRNKEGTGDALVYDPVTQEARCVICGYKFRPIEPDVSPEEIANDVLRLQDILQTIKLLYIDLPPQSSQEFFPIIALLDKVPKLFDYAVKNMTKHEAYNWQYNGRNMGAINLFTNLQNMFGGMSAMGGMGMPNMQQQPMMGGMPGMMGAPNMYNPATAMMSGGMANGFGYPGASAANGGMMMGGAPSQPSQPGGFQFTQTQQSPAVTDKAPIVPADTTVTQTVNA